MSSLNVGTDAMADEFKAQFDEAVAERQAKEDALREKNVGDAADHVADFETARRDKLMNTTMKLNREKEHEFLDDLHRGEECENPWERVLTLVDLNPETPEADGPDVARLRKVLIQKKNEDAKKPVESD
mmetsp:Transcript_18659/g.57497  ORF Transcript_18659/g.57497 Transcript_18659/m.57497 type:complete len:129 (-) Transcript_18659:86-472(-)